MTLRKRLAPWQHCVLACIVTVVALALVYGGAIRPAQAYLASSREAVAALQDRLARYRQLASERQVLEKQLETLEQDRTRTEDFLRGGSSALAAAALVQHIQSLAEQYGAKLVSSQSVEEAGNDLYPKVTIRMHIKGSMEAVTKMCHSLESGAPRVFLDRLTFQKQYSVLTNAWQEDTTNPVLNYVDEIDLRFDASGYLLTEQS